MPVRCTVAGVPDLTGPFETNKLPRIAPGAATITIARTLKPGTEAAFLAWSERSLAAVRAAEGCLGAVMLRPGADSDEYHTIFRFVDVLHLRRWERSDVRDDLRAELDDIILTERVTVTSGSDSFFDAQAANRPFRSKTLQFVFDLAWVYPVTIGATIFFAPHVAQLPLWARAAITTVVFGFANRFMTAPLKRRIERRMMLPAGEILR
jgi:hypothetical protein